LQASEAAAHTDTGIDEAWEQKKAAEAAILAHRSASLPGIALKLRVLARWMDVENAECANHDGMRTNPLVFDEVMLASALAGVERLAG
jgi:hypothetical protein